MSLDFKLRRLNSVLAVFDQGSTLRAAEALHMSQPAVAASVAACEADVGTKLFERSTRGMTATTEGVAFVGRVRAALSHLELAEAFIRQKGGKRGQPFHRLATEVQLHALIAVVENGGFLAAARRLQMSQSSLHRATRELEGLCGARLWRSYGAGIEPTSEGRELSRYAGLCFNEVRASFEEIRELQGIVAGQLNVGALPLARSKWLPDALLRTLRIYPDARVRIMDGPYEEQLEALRHARIDMILGALRDPLPVADINQKRLFSDPWLIVVRLEHPLASGFNSVLDKLTPAQLDSLSWILPRRGAPGRETFERFMANKGVPSPTRVVECSSFVTTRALLLESDHAAVLSRQQVEADLAQGTLKIMGPPLTGSSRPIGLTVRRDFRPTRLQQLFLDNTHSYVESAGLTR